MNSGIGWAGKDPPLWSPLFLWDGIKDEVVGGIWRSFWNRTFQLHRCDAIGLHMQPLKDAANMFPCISSRIIFTAQAGDLLFYQWTINWDLNDINFPHLPCPEYNSGETQTWNFFTAQIRRRDWNPVNAEQTLTLSGDRSFIFIFL